MTETIIQKLLELEQLENIKILYAYESGSQAWRLIVILMCVLYARSVNDYIGITFPLKGFADYWFDTSAQ